MLCMVPGLIPGRTSRIVGWHVPRGRLILARSVWWVQLPSGPLEKMGSWSNAKTPERHSGNPGSIPGGSTETEGSRLTVCRAAVLTRFSPVEMRVRLPCLPLGVPSCRPDGEMDIMPRFYRGVPGSSPGRGADNKRTVSVV